jgi:hypothetical protein
MTSKFRAFDSELLANTYNTLSQIQANIEQIVSKSEGNIDSVADLPDSIIATDTLLVACVCYEVMYHALLDAHLLNSGHHKQSSKTIH